MFQRRINAKTDSGVIQDLLASRDIVDGLTGQFGIGYRDGRVGERADPGGAQADLFDRARLAAYAAEITDAHWLLGIQAQCPEDILQGLLQGKGDGDK